MRAMKLFQMTPDGATRFNVTEPLEYRLLFVQIFFVMGLRFESW